MKKIIIIILSTIFLLILINKVISRNTLSIPKQSKQITFTAKSEKVVSTGELFRLTFTVNDIASGFRAPVFNNFQVVSGPNTMTSQNYTYVNGKSTQEISTSYTYHLIANKVGTLTIPAAQVTVNGKTYSSKPIEITVVQGEANNTNNSNENNTNKPQNTNISDNVFVKTIYNKTSAYPGEFIIATTRLYTKMDIRNLSENSSPKYTGFWIKDIQAPQNLSAQREVINGKVYSSALLRQTIIFPQKIGKYTIEPYELEISVKQSVGKDYDFFGRLVNKYAYVKKIIKSNSTTINVKPFPEKEPENFSGIVGHNFTINSKIDKTKLKTDENINYSFKITGNGNLYLFNESGLEVPESFDAYKPNIEANIKYTANGGIGYKEFKYILLARKYGNVTIPPVEFVYFNTETKKFETLKSDSYNIEIEKGDNYSTVINEGVQVINKDIRYINEKNLNLKLKNTHFGGSPIFYFSFLTAMILFIAFILIRRKTIKENSDIAKVRNKKAAKISQQRLKAANNFLENDKETEFYNEILKSLNGYLTDKLNLNQNLATKAEIASILAEKGLDDQFIDSILEIMNTCEFAQYGSINNNKTPDIIYSETENIIKSLENLL